MIFSRKDAGCRIVLQHTQQTMSVCTITHTHRHTIDTLDYVTVIGNIVTSPINSNTFRGGTTGAIRVAWLCGPLLESV